MNFIINSLLDTDFYKFTMGQFAWKYYPDVKVKYAFKNRTDSIKLGNFIDIDELLAELNAVKLLKFKLSGLNYLKNLGILSDDYLHFLNTLQLPPVFVRIENEELVIETEGSWKEAIFWETFILSIVNELYYRHWSHSMAGYIGEFNDRLDGKIKIINKHPFKFADFGTRRRYSKEIHEEVIQKLIEGVYNSSFMGTSNVYLAKKYNLKPIGTLAHELPMVLAGLSDYNLEVLKSSHNKMLTLWGYLYGKELSIALTDTFGTDFFFRDFSTEKAKFWKGLRQDSGDAFEFGNKAIEFYKDKGINPKEKVIVFSDGLNIDTILKLEKEFKDKFITSYGWGTNLTNDLGFEPLSIVVKAVKADGVPLVKLSDNLAKAIGDKKTMDKYKKVFVYDNTFNEQTLY